MRHHSCLLFSCSAEFPASSIWVPTADPRDAQVVASVAGVIIITALTLHILRRRKARAYAGNKSTQPSSRNPLSRLVSAIRRKGGNYQAAAADDSADGQQTSHQLGQRASQQAHAERGTTASATVDRHTSVRSVLTLPAYSRAAAHTEQVLGREGDRDGIDVVVDNPTQEDEEELREREMDALYQLRAARRQHNADRETLRMQRQEAQRSHNMAALNEIRARSRNATSQNNTQVDELRRGIDQAKENRQRSVSSVSYADLGVARHDGTRIRANSNDSERMGLLSDAASIAISGRTGASSPQPPSHRRASSVASMDSDFPSPALPRNRDSQPPTPRRMSAAPGRAGSSPELVESDLGVESIPPPEYEDVSLDDGNAHRSTTPLDEPPPDYPGPYRSNSLASSNTNAARQSEDGDMGEGDARGQSAGRGVGGMPQLPSLRIARLPEIVIDSTDAQSPTRR
jgi:hypothetical protein